MRLGKYFALFQSGKLRRRMLRKGADSNAQARAFELQRRQDVARGDKISPQRKVMKLGLSHGKWMLKGATS